MSAERLSASAGAAGLPAVLPADLLHGVALRPPELAWDGARYRGSQLLSVRLAEVRGLAGVVAAVQRAHFAGVVAVTMAARRILIQIPQRTMARGRMREASRSFIPLRLNSSGVMPIVFAQSVIVIPGAAAQYLGNPALRDFADYLNPGASLYYILSAILILLREQAR